MGGWNECPQGFPFQNQLVVTEPNIVGWTGLPMIKPKKFQWTCKFENQENESGSGGQSWAFLFSNEYHIWGVQNILIWATPPPRAPEMTEGQVYLPPCPSSGPLPYGKGHSVSTTVLLTLYRCPILSLWPTPVLRRKAVLILFISQSTIVTTNQAKWDALSLRMSSALVCPSAHTRPNHA